MGLQSVIKRYAALQVRLETLPEALADSIDYNREELLQLRKDEMLLGRNSDGDPFAPDYLHDPYFKTPQAALVYANYKYRAESIHNARIEHALPYPNKDGDTPNLRSTRDKYNPLSFQDQMYIVTTSQSFLIYSRFRGTADINAKYGQKVFPLGPGARLWYWNNILVEDLRLHIYKR